MADAQFNIEVVKKPNFKIKKEQGKAATLQTLIDIGQLVAADVAAESPYRTGRMRRSHRSRIRNEMRVDVIGWTPYLEYVLYGTRYIQPRNWPRAGVARAMSVVYSTIRAASNFRKL